MGLRERVGRVGLRPMMVLAVVLAGCAARTQATGGDDAALTAKVSELASRACAGPADVNSDGSATCRDDTSTSMLFFVSDADRDAYVEKLRANGSASDGTIIEGPGWYILCQLPDAARIVGATGGMVV